MMYSNPPYQPYPQVSTPCEPADQKKDAPKNILV
jgi:hypothetical protein